MKNNPNIQKQTQDPTVSALRPFGTSIFTEMTALAVEFGAVNLSQGFPDFEGPLEVRQKAAEAIIRGPNQYPPSMGIPALRQAIARKMMRFYGIEVYPETEVTVTAGATEGLTATLLGILEPGDEVILIEPAYDSYAPIASLAGAGIRFVRLAPPDFNL
ncbi:aminotransferase class I/II-fold pyridoxal phosphate-dependent enzyme, partial [bacterium]|nr:aminotransferase class I/II-fold pyridoxal phosphate-dependent enzyme [bacterium]